MSPFLDNVNTIRDFMAFEEHVQNARARRGAKVPDEWYQGPTFYFTNSGRDVLYGDDAQVPYPEHTKMLDIELEVAAIIGKSGSNIKADDAESYIAGFTIYGDWSARDVQRREMAVGLGPCKSKDFAQSLGPYVVPLTELEAKRVDGNHWDLNMDLIVNDRRIGGGNLKNIHYSFSELIEYASNGVTLYPGDVIGSGTVGTGCILELPDEEWLQRGDKVELKVDLLGSLKAAIS